jgi:hypothetical protein
MGDPGTGVQAFGWTFFVVSPSPRAIRSKGALIFSCSICSVMGFCGVCFLPVKILRINHKIDKTCTIQRRQLFLVVAMPQKIKGK